MLHQPFQAGKVSGDPKDTVESTLKQYRIVDEITALKHDAHIWKTDEFVPPRKLPPIQGAQFLGTNTQVNFDRSYKNAFKCEFIDQQTVESSRFNTISADD